ncbi:hypothetical protein BOTCAL_0037g00110 [Botryotinia calthae]|uniref:Uncharacterized protein n=1 Tax=Botryotinia calthae TaxID=38488 RepID=A0A4Y8DCD3_9HELO|nr:hypothetical protein BOTCAL_0037g00110 [Botryotinia calthae]
MEFSNTTWLSIMGSTFYYISLLIVVISNWLLAILRIALAPLLHLGNSLASALLLPLKTIIIFLGSAIIIGLISGSLLRVSSSTLASLFKLTASPEDTRRSVAPIRAAREHKKRNSTPDVSKWKVDPSVDKRYSGWLENDGGRKKDDHGLSAQIIIEEDDDSDGGF